MIGEVAVLAESRVTARVVINTKLSSKHVQAKISRLQAALFQGTDLQGVKYISGTITGDLPYPHPSICPSIHPLPTPFRSAYHVLAVVFTWSSVAVCLHSLSVLTLCLSDSLYLF